MIDDLPPDLRALISASRSRLAPDAATIARVHTSVHAAVATGGIAAGASAIVAKLAVVVAITAAVATATVAYVRHTPSKPAVAPTITITESSAASDEPEIAPRIIAVEREPAPHPAIEPVVAPVAPIPAPPPAPPTLAREIELIDRASKALHRADHAAVLATIATYDAETSGHGQLAQDAAAIALEAACGANDPTAATKLAAFTRRWPHSAQHTRFAAACHQGDSR